MEPKKPVLSNKMLTHEKDIEYFNQYPAPLFELLQSTHFTNVNSTLPFFGPMIYYLVRTLGCEQVLEIGHAEGYTAYYMAHGVKDNGTRFGMKENRYYGIDIVQTEKTEKNLKDAGLPATIINLDTIHLTPQTFKNIKFDLIFQDGAHDTKHILHELNTLYPQLKGEGKGYWLFHDCYGPGEEAFRKLIQLLKEPCGSCKKFNFEWVRIDCVYGLAILRKMDKYDYNKKHWTNGL